MTGEYSLIHPHEPAIQPFYDSEGRCLVCGLVARAENAENAATEMTIRYAEANELLRIERSVGSKLTEAADARAEAAEAALAAVEGNKP